MRENGTSPNTLYGFELDSDDGVAQNSITLKRVGSGYQPAGANATGMSVHGSAINDWNLTTGTVAEPITDWSSRIRARARSGPRMTVT